MQIELPPMFINADEERNVLALRERYSGYTGYTGWEVAYRREQQLLEAMQAIEDIKRERDK